MEKTASRILEQLLKILDVKATPTQINEEVEKHPGPENLLAFGGLLSNWRVAHNIKSVSKYDIAEIRCPFLTMYLGKTIIVLSYNDSKVGIFSNTGKFKSVEKSRFDTSYSGFVLIVKVEKSSGEENYVTNKRIELVESLRPYFLLIGAISLLLIYFMTRWAIFKSYNSNYFLLVGIILAGLIVTIILLLQNVDKDNPLVQSLCGSDKDKNCNAVLGSDASYITKELSWSEVGFFYFAGNFLLLLFSKQVTTELFRLLGYINLLCLPYTFYSIFFQWRIVKQWCILCCIIQAILWVEFLLFKPYLRPINLGTIYDWLVVAGFFFLPVLLWFFFKPYMSRSQEIPALKQQLYKFKYNKQLFHNLLLEGSKYELLPYEKTLTFGKSDALHTITMVSNPFCGHCARMHRTLNQWLPGRKDIRFQVVFLTGYDRQKRLIAEHLISLKLKGQNRQAKRALDAWYRLRTKNYKKWSREFKVDFDPVSAEIINLQNRWCKNVSITGTPTLFIDGYELPVIYQASEIKYLI